MGWVSPTGYSNNDGWDDIVDAYDGDEATYAPCKTITVNYTYWCQFDRDYVWCNQVRVLATRTFGADTIMYVEAYYDGAWHAVLTTQVYDVPPEWFAANLEAAKHVTAVRVGWKKTSGGYHGDQWGKVYEIQLYAVASAPTAPTLLRCEGRLSPTTGVVDLTPELSAILNDPDPSDTLTHVAIQVATDSGFSNLLWDSGWLDIADIVAGNRCADVSYAGTAIAQVGETFYWRIKTKDDEGAEGSWSATSTFTMAPKQVGISDAGAGVDVPWWFHRVVVPDVGEAAEDVSWLRAVAVPDVGQASVEYIRAAFRIITVSDAGAATEAISPLNWIRTRSIRINAPAKDPVKAYPAKDAMIEYDPNAGGE